MNHDRSLKKWKDERVVFLWFFFFFWKLYKQKAVLILWSFIPFSCLSWDNCLITVFLLSSPMSEGQFLTLKLCYSPSSSTHVLLNNNQWFYQLAFDQMKVSFLIWLRSMNRRIKMSNNDLFLKNHNLKCHLWYNCFRLCLSIHTMF